MKIQTQLVGAAGNAVARLLVLDGAKNIIGFNVDGVIHPDMNSDDPMQRWFIEHSNKENFQGTMSQALVGADVFIGLLSASLFKSGQIGER